MTDVMSTVIGMDSMLDWAENPIEVQGMYYSNQRMLLIGEGDFSFSSCLATQFGFATNMVATSKDSIGELHKYYGTEVFTNIENLRNRGAQVCHGVDVTNMVPSSEGVLPLGGCTFNVIIFNFPHAGFFGREHDPKVIRKHTNLMRSFFKAAASMLSHGGLIYVSHKCGPPYDNWNLRELAEENGLEFVKNIPFCPFPGYIHRRGSGHRAGEIFPLGQAATYIFQIRDCIWTYCIEKCPLQTKERNDTLVEISNLQSLKGKEIGCGRASSETPLLQIICTEVARLEALRLGQTKQQRKLMRLKSIAKMIHLLIETPSAVQSRRIKSLQATSSSEKWQQIHRSAQKVLKKAIKERQEQTLLSEKCTEPVLCVSTKNEYLPPQQRELKVEEVKNESPPQQQRELKVEEVKNESPPQQQCELQVEEVLDIHVADGFADEPPLESEGDENYPDSVCAFVQEIQNILFNTGYEIEGRDYMCLPDQEENTDFHKENQTQRPTLELSQNSVEVHGDLLIVVESFQGLDGGQSDHPLAPESFQGSDIEQIGEMPQGDEVLCVGTVMTVWEPEDMEGEDVLFQPRSSFADTIFSWICTIASYCNRFWHNCCSLLKSHRSIAGGERGCRIDPAAFLLV